MSELGPVLAVAAVQGARLIRWHASTKKSARAVGEAIGLAATAESSGNLPTAEAKYREALVINERNPWAHMRLGVVIWMQHNHREGEARGHLSRATELWESTPAEYMPHHLEATLLFFDGRSNEVQASINKAWQVAPKDPRTRSALLTLAGAARIATDPLGASTLLETALNADPANYQAAYWLAMSQAERGLVTQAASTATHAQSLCMGAAGEGVDLSAQVSQNLSLLAELAEKRGDTASARATLRQALSLWRGNKSAWVALLVLEMHKGSRMVVREYMGQLTAVFPVAKLGTLSDRLLEEAPFAPNGEVVIEALFESHAISGATYRRHKERIRSAAAALTAAATVTNQYFNHSIVGVNAMGANAVVQDTHIQASGG